MSCARRSTAIIGFSDVLLREGGRATTIELMDYGAQINAAGKRLLGLINTILDVARIETGRFEPSGEVADVEQILQAAIRQLHSAALAAEVSVALNLPDGLPRLRVDDRRMVQAVVQLLSNAVKFTPAGGSVTVAAAPTPEGGLRLAITDTGIGMAEGDLDRVFEPFIQLDDALSRRYDGSGLGLYVARAIVHAQGGEVRLLSEPGRGTTAEISLPSKCIVL